MPAGFLKSNKNIIKRAKFAVKIFVCFHQKPLHIVESYSARGPIVVVGIDVVPVVEVATANRPHSSPFALIGSLPFQDLRFIDT